VGVNRQFQAETRTSKNRTVSETTNPIKPNFDDIAVATNYTSWVFLGGRHLEIGYRVKKRLRLVPLGWVKFGMPTRNPMPMMMET